MDSEANASSAQGCDNDEPARGTVRSLPRLRAANIEKNKEKMKFKNRRKVLSLNSPAPPNGDSDESDGHDSDYVPSSPVQAGIAEEGSNRKRHRKQARRHAPAEAAVAPRGVVGGQDVPKRRPVSI